MSTDVCIYVGKQVFESLVTYSEVRNLQLFINYMGGLTLQRALSNWSNEGKRNLLVVSISH